MRLSAIGTFTFTFSLLLAAGAAGACEIKGSRIILRLENLRSSRAGMLHFQQAKREACHLQA